MCIITEEKAFETMSKKIDYNMPESVSGNEVKHILQVNNSRYDKFVGTKEAFDILSILL